MQGVYAGLDHALASFHEQHPGVVVKLRQAQAEDVWQAVRDGTVDLALVALEREQQRGLATRLLSQEEMVLITAATCGLPKGRSVMLAEVAALRLVDFPVGWAIRHAVDRAFRAAIVERTTTFEVNEVLTPTDLVRHDLGVCILPESLAARFPDLAVRRFAAHAPARKVMVVRPSGEVLPALAALLRHIN
jgi:DNA-binding transcriptional LysR family regulator